MREHARDALKDMPADMDGLSNMNAKVMLEDFTLDFKI